MLGTALSIIAIAIGMYLVIRPASVVRSLIKVFNKMDILHPPGPIFTLLVFLIGAILFVFGAITLFR